MATKQVTFSDGTSIEFGTLDHFEAQGDTTVAHLASGEVVPISVPLDEAAAEYEKHQPYNQG